MLDPKGNMLTFFFLKKIFLRQLKANDIFETSQKVWENQQIWKTDDRRRTNSISWTPLAKCWLISCAYVLRLYSVSEQHIVPPKQHFLARKQNLQARSRSACLFPKLRISCLSTLEGRYFRSTGSGFRDTGRFSKLPYLGMKLDHWQKVPEVARTRSFYPKGSKSSLFSLYG